MDALKDKPPREITGTVKGKARVTYHIIDGKLVGLTWDKKAFATMNTKKDLSKSDKMKLKAQRRFIAGSLEPCVPLSRYFI